MITIIRLHLKNKTCEIDAQSCFLLQLSQDPFSLQNTSLTALNPSSLIYYQGATHYYATFSRVIWALTVCFMETKNSLSPQSC